VTSVVSGDELRQQMIDAADAALVDDIASGYRAPIAAAAVDAVLPFVRAELAAVREVGRDEGLYDAYAIVASEGSKTFGFRGRLTAATKACLAAQKRIREEHSQSAVRLARGSVGDE
jgi:hypothetical protein